MILKETLYREIGHRESNLHQCLDPVVEDFICVKQDEHFVEGEESGLIPPLAVGFHKVQKHILGLVEEDGGIIIYDTNQLSIAALKQDWLGHKNAIFDLDWMPDEDKLLTASGDQTIALWDVEQEESISTFRGHKSSIKTVRFLDSNKNLFASGARDGCIMMWDARVQPKAQQGDEWKAPVNVLNNGHNLPITTPKSSKKRQSAPVKDGPQQSITSVVFRDEYNLITASSVDGSIKVWDTRKTYNTNKNPLAKCTFPYFGDSSRTHGFASLVLDSTKTQLFASCMDNVIYQYDCAAFTQKPVASFRGHQMGTFYIKLAMSADDNYLLSGSSDNNAYVWNVHTPYVSPLKLTGHSGEVSDVAWCAADFTKLVTSSDDGTMRIWRVRRNRDDQQLQLGEVVGTTVRAKRDVGTYMTRSAIKKSHGRLLPKFSHQPSSTTQQQQQLPQPPRNTLLSPIKGTMLPASPAKISPAVRRSLLTMNNASPSGRGSPSSSVTKHAVVKSPSVFNWLANPTTSKQDSPLKSPGMKSPRKLTITPLKSPSGECMSGVKALQDSTSKLQNAERAQGVKRKLCDMSPVCDRSATKRQCPGVSGAQAATPGSGVARKSLFGGDAAVSASKSPLKRVSPRKRMSRGTPQKGISPYQPRVSPRKRYQSPTVNLPNYVFDPQPRTPVGKLIEQEKVKTPDWLTQISKSKQKFKRDEAENSPGGGGNRLMASSPQTPRGSKRLRALNSPHTPRSSRKDSVENSPATPTSRRVNSRGNTPRTGKRVGLRPATPTAASVTAATEQKTPTLQRKGSILQYFSPKVD